MTRELLRDKFHRDGYCVIENCFNESMLEEVLQHTISNVGDDWWLSYFPGEDAEEPSWTEVDEEGKYREHIKFAQEAASHMGTHSNYLTYAFVRTKNEAYLHDLKRLIEAYFDDIEYITGIKCTGFNGVFLSSYEPGCFLAPHSDEFDPPAPPLSFVLGLTKKWAPHWGGLTHIEGKDPFASTAIFPKYNCLLLFKIPAWHMVTEVAQSAPHHRRVLSGWLQAAPIPHTPSSFWSFPY
jgi:hypothetical protein